MTAWIKRWNDNSESGRRAARLEMQKHGVERERRGGGDINRDQHMVKDTVALVSCVGFVDALLRLRIANHVAVTLHAARATDRRIAVVVMPRMEGVGSQSERHDCSDQLPHRSEDNRSTSGSRRMLTMEGN